MCLKLSVCDLHCNCFRYYSFTQLSLFEGQRDSYKVTEKVDDFTVKMLRIDDLFSADLSFTAQLQLSRCV